MKRDGARNCMNHVDIHETVCASTRNAAKSPDKYVVLAETPVLAGETTVYARRRTLRAWDSMRGIKTRDREEFHRSILYKKREEIHRHVL